MTSLFSTTEKSHRRYGMAFFLGIITGIISAMVKSGSEGILPPRTPDRVAPPVQLLQDLGINPDMLTYTFSGHIVSWGGSGVHYLFSIGAAVVYCWLAEIFPKIKMGQGAVFAVVFAIASHGILLPVFDLSPALWNLPADEIISELVGTIIWMWVIEVFRRDLRNRMTGLPDPEFSQSQIGR